ncbi:hypothetical protein ACJX0J_012874, partial [Zea mays]
NTLSSKAEVSIPKICDCLAQNLQKSYFEASSILFPLSGAAATIMFSWQSFLKLKRVLAISLVSTCLNVLDAGNNRSKAKEKDTNKTTLPFTLISFALTKNIKLFLQIISSVTSNAAAKTIRKIHVPTWLFAYTADGTGNGEGQGGGYDQVHMVKEDYYFPCLFKFLMFIAL